MTQSSPNAGRGQHVPRRAIRRTLRSRAKKSWANAPSATLQWRRRGSQSATGPGRSRRRRHATKQRRGRHPILLGLLTIGVFVPSGIGWAYHDLNTNIDSHDVDELLGPDRPTPITAPTADDTDDTDEPPADPAEGQALNVLLIGSDSRDGDNQDVGGGHAEGIRSDTVLLAHISADRERIDVISIPRDSWVPIPECELPDGSTSGAYEGKFNGAFQAGGSTGDVGYAAACSMRTVESLTGVRLDGFIAVDFVGFIDVVDALGGVPFCVPEPVSDRRADLELDAGEQTLDGADALGFARARYSMGDGSDVQRIDRQQELLAATVRHALDQNLLTDGPKLYAFLDAATSAMSTSSEFGSITTLAGLANSLRGIDPAEINFVTVPWVDRGDGANVVWTQEADALWEAIAADQALVVDNDDSDDDGSGDGASDQAGEESDEDSDAAGPTVDGSTAQDEQEVCG